MAVKEIVPIENHVVEAIELLPEQFKNLEQKFPDPNHPKKLVSGWEAILTAFVNPAQKYENICQDLLRSYDLRFTTGRALNRLGELVGQVRAGKTDEEYRTAILIKIGANNSEGTYNDLVGLYEMFGLSVQSYLEPKPATFLFHLGPIAKETMESVKEVTEVAKAAGVAYEFTGVISDPSDPIDKDEPLFIFKSGGKGEYFATMLADGNRSEYGGRWSLLLKSSVPVPPDVTYELAIGAIQMSLLDEATFATAMGADAVNWVLADGREVNGSKYTQVTANETVPNMAGKFTRMATANAEILEEQDSSLNVSDVGLETSVGGTLIDVGGLAVSVTGNRNQFNNGSTSTDLTTNQYPIRSTQYKPTVDNSLLGFYHTFLVKSSSSLETQNYSVTTPNHTHKPVLSGNFSMSGSTSQGTKYTGSEVRVTTITGGTETRPTNMSVYYYIKIN